jgi:hypothetical protein
MRKEGGGGRCGRARAPDGDGASLARAQTMFPAEGEDSEAMFAEFQARVLAEVTNIETEIRNK